MGQCVVPSRGRTESPAGGIAGAGVHAASGGEEDIKRGISVRWILTLFMKISREMSYQIVSKVNRGFDFIE